MKTLKSIKSRESQTNTTQTKAKNQTTPETILQTYSKPSVNTPFQLKSYIKNKSQSYNYGKGSVQVGKKMQAWLDPNDNIIGQSANLNSSQDAMMTAIRQRWGINGGDLVKGHLLNDNLGGTALNENLYPITRAANKDHLMYVENLVKHINWTKKEGVYYEINVDGTPNYKNADASFNTEVWEWNPKNDKFGDQISAVSVQSDLNDVRNYHQAFNTEDEDEELDTYKNPHRPKGIKPKTRVSELTQDELDDRMDQD